MTPERWARLRELFAAAVEADPEGRASLVAMVGAEDSQLAAELARLLAGDAGWTDHEATSRMPRADVANAADADLPERIDRYRILGDLGEGGMGRVFLAERDDGVYRQRVALKVLAGGTFGSELARRRFRAERQILARLSHPAIARLIDGGETPAGEPFLAMEYVDGRRIDEYCRAQGLAPEALLELFLRVCEAVVAAHRSLVVHRDLKPSNVLVTPDGEPKLLDFGIAKLLAAEEGDEATLLTRHGQAPLTPRYASPEQVRGEPVTVATDVYSLGVMLYELLTGSSPYGDESLTPPSLALAICERQPRAPSAAAKTATHEGAMRTGPTLGGRARWLMGDLDAIVLKALRKEPDARYGSVGELADDLRRLLAGHPVAARAGSKAYRWRKLVRRHRVAIAGGATVAAALVVAAVVSLGQARAAARDRDRALFAEGRARREAGTAAQVVDFLVGLYERADPERTQGRVPTVVEVLDESRAALREGGPREPEVRAALQVALARAYLEMGRGEPAAALAGDAVAALRARGQGEPAAALLALGQAQALLGDLAAAERSLRAARKAALAPGTGRDQTLARQTASALAKVLTEATRYDEARRLRLAELTQAAAGLGVDPAAPRLPQGQLGKEWGDLAIALYELADLDLDRGDYATAVETSRRALAVGERVWGPGDSRVAKLEMGLGNALDEVDRVQEAAAIMTQAVASYRRVFGPRHVEVGKALVNYGGVLRRVDRNAEAVAALEEAVALFDASVGRVHRYTAVALNNLANVYIGMGKPERGLATHLDALAVRRKLWPADHPEVAQSLRNIGNLQLDLGRSRAGLPYLEQAAAAYQASLGPAHPNTVDARMAVGAALAALEDWKRARPVLEDAYAKSAALEDPLLRARIAQHLALAVEAQGEAARALELSREALRLTEGLGLGREEYDLAALRRQVARLAAVATPAR